MSAGRRRCGPATRSKREKELSQEPICSRGDCTNGTSGGEESQQEGPGPYKSDLEYLQDELDWVEERTRRILDETALARVEAGEEVDD